MKVRFNFFSVIFLFVCTAFSSYAQSEDEPKTSAYIFPDFIEGAIKLGSGTTNKMKLNYNTFTQEMMYDESGQYTVLSNSNVDTIFISNRMFVPAEKGYYELGVKGNTPLLIQYRSMVELPGINTAFGMSTQAVSAEHISPENKEKLYQLIPPANFAIKTEVLYWLYKNKQYIKANNLKQVQAVFVKNADKIKEYSKTNNVSFSKVDDVKKLIVYCNSLPE